MFEIITLYPYVEGGKFDAEYYATQHMPMVEKLIPAMTGWAFEEYLPIPNIPVTYRAIGHMFTNSIEEFFGAMMQHADVINPDVAKYFDGTMGFQVCKVTVGKSPK